MGFFSKFRKEKVKDIEDSSNNSVNQFLSFVLYNEYENINELDLLKKYNEICNSSMKATDIVKKDHTVTFTIDGSMGFISFMPAPYPWEDLEGPCMTSWLWKEAKEDLKNHKKHIIISWLAKNKEPAEICKIVSQITASVLEEVNGIGVYWSSACLVNKKDVFCNMVYDINEMGLPLFLWIDFRIEKHTSGELNVITYGLDKFNLMELEIIKSTKSFEELIDFSLSIVRYLIANGNVINDGDTLGEDENQRIIARHTSSVWTNDDRGIVLRVQY